MWTEHLGNRSMEINEYNLIPLVTHRSGQLLFEILKLQFSTQHLKINRIEIIRYWEATWSKPQLLCKYKRTPDETEWKSINYVSQSWEYRVTLHLGLVYVLPYQRFIKIVQGGHILTVASKAVSVHSCSAQVLSDWNSDKVQVRNIAPLLRNSLLCGQHTCRPYVCSLQPYVCIFRLPCSEFITYTHTYHNV